MKCSAVPSALGYAGCPGGHGCAADTDTSVAGFEWGTGFYINPTPPEEAAKFLREASVEQQATVPA